MQLSGSQVMLMVMDNLSGGVMQERRVEGTCVRDLQKSPTSEDLDRNVGRPHAPHSVQRYRRFDVPRPETVPGREEHRPAAVPDPSRPMPRAVCITRAMQERHGYS